MKLYHGTSLEGFLEILKSDCILPMSVLNINDKSELVSFYARSFEQAFLHGIYIFEIDLSEIQFYENFIDTNDDTNENDVATTQSIYISNRIDEDDLIVSNIFIPNINYDLNQKIDLCYGTTGNY